MVSWSKLSLYSKAAIITVTIQALVVGALEATLAALIIPAVNTKRDSQPVDVAANEVYSSNLESVPTYLILFFTSQLFQIYFLVDGVLHKNTLQLMAFVALSTCTVAYSIFQIDQLDEDDDLEGVDISEGNRTIIRSSLYAMSAVAAVGTVISAFLAFKLYCEFGWRIYKKIGANPKLRKIFRTYQMLIMIMKLDLFFGVLFSIQYLTLVLEPDDYEFYVTIAGSLVLTPVMLIVATYGLRQENRAIMYGFFAAIIAYIVYFTYKLVSMYVDPTKPRVINGVTREVDVYRGARNFLTFFSVISIIMVIITLINAILCFRNFGKGLKPHVLKQKEAATASGLGTPASTHSQSMEEPHPQGTKSFEYQNTSNGYQGHGQQGYYQNNQGYQGYQPQQGYYDQNQQQKQWH